MPIHNENMAPKFDSTKPQKLPYFFEDLELLFARAWIEEDKTKKKLAIVHYVNYTMGQMWKTFPEFKSPTTSYQDFKKAIFWNITLTLQETSFTHSSDTPVVCIDMDACNFSNLPLINITEIVSILLVTIESWTWYLCMSVKINEACITLR